MTDGFMATWAVTHEIEVVVTSERWGQTRE